MGVCVSFVFCHSVGSRVSLSSPNLISVESPNTVFGRYACAKDPLQLDRFTQGVIPGGAGGGGGGCGPPTFGQQHFFQGFHTPLTERYHQKWC